MTRRRTSIAVLSLALTFFLASLAAAAPRPAKKTLHPKRPPLEMVWHVETLSGEVVNSRLADAPINPASVVKVATSWWALDELGPDHRFETRFRLRGTLDRARGVLRGDLVVEGGGDPDFQTENAFLVAAALNRLDVRQVTGGLVVNHEFWMGWEDGSAGMERDPDRRATLMGTRLRQALDPRAWTRSTRAAWQEFALRRGLYSDHPPRVAIAKAVRVADAAEGSELAVVHRSKPLADTLRRFNCFSNNDIERVGAALGTAGELARRLGEAIGASPDLVQLETTSGLGENRISPRLVVRMMREFRRTGDKVGRGVESLLPVAGCDPGTVTRFFPQLSAGPNATSLVAKTGTLTATDGGVSVLAGFLNTAQGELVFCLAAPRAGGRVKRARHQEEQWLLGLLASRGGPAPRPCAPPLPTADADADVVLAAFPAGDAAPNGGGERNRGVAPTGRRALARP
jgi:serine-type D-Ala-D-Ala carboxypeptidase/endopeptidase (penicillin-binding protein 4)